MAKAVQALQAKEVNRIILSRPAVEAGERLVSCPGTLSEKIDPYLRPLYDALHDMVDPDTDPQAAGSRHDRGRPAGVPARPLAQRLLHHPRRGAEHHARADEDVPDPPRLRLAHRRHRRHQPGRPAVGHQVRAARGRGHPRRRRGHHVLPPHRHRRRTPPPRRSDRGGLRGLRRRHEARGRPATAPRAERGPRSPG